MQDLHDLSEKQPTLQQKVPSELGGVGEVMTIGSAVVPAAADSPLKSMLGLVEDCPIAGSEVEGFCVAGRGASASSSTASKREVKQSLVKSLLRAGGGEATGRGDLFTLPAATSSISE